MPGRRKRIEEGQGLVEYALILAVVALAVVIGLTLMGEGIAGAIYNDIILDALMSI
jgi:Flp pilus assembly pilin Flp